MEHVAPGQQGVTYRCHLRVLVPPMKMIHKRIWERSGKMDILRVCVVCAIGEGLVGLSALSLQVIRIVEFASVENDHSGGSHAPSFQ